MSDEQTNVGPNSATPAGLRPGSALKLAALLLPLLFLVAGAAYWLHSQPSETETADPPRVQTHDWAGTDLFHGWPEPDFVVVLTAQQHGYLLPCGCSKPQFGGLERRYNFMQRLRDHGWKVVAYDLGDMPQITGPANLPNIQGLIKYRYAMEAHKRMGYSAVSFGEYEAAQPLNDAIDNYALNSDEPAILAANLLKKQERFPADKDDKKHQAPEWGGSYVGSWQVTQAAPGIRVGALGIIGTHDAAGIADLMKAGELAPGTIIPPSVGGHITAMDRKFAFEPAGQAIGNGLAQMALKKPDFQVLLYQGPVELAKPLAQHYPQFNIILCLSAEDEPPGLPVIVGNTFIIRVGHKGKNLGVVGVNSTANPGRPFDMRYQLVPMAETYATPKGKEQGNPILGLIEAYTRELKADNYLARYGKIPHTTQASIKAMAKFAGARAGYVGSDTCKNCHKTAHAIWAASPHSGAYKTLQSATNPSLREFDAECIVCHTIGFRYTGGFEDMAKTPKLINVGCESCHGPCEIHKNNPNDKAIWALINPWKAPKGEAAAQKSKRMLRIEGMCRECHDAENDVHWNFAKWEEKKIIHMTPPDERQSGDDQ